MTIRTRRTSIPVRTSGIGAFVVATSLFLGACGPTDTSNPKAQGDAVLSNESQGDVDQPQYGESVDDFLDQTLGTPNLKEPTVNEQGFTELSWEHLVPVGSTSNDITEKYKERLAALEDGSPEAVEIYREMRAEYDEDAVSSEFEGTAVQISGFVAPLTYSGDLITEFLLVPSFGACIHVPAPPPNQTIFVALKDGEGLEVEESYGVVWVQGTLTVASESTDLATAGYAISDAQSGVHNQQ